jgi:hypothetical protein
MEESSVRIWTLWMRTSRFIEWWKMLSVLLTNFTQGHSKMERMWKRKHLKRRDMSMQKWLETRTWATCVPKEVERISDTWGGRPRVNNKNMI